MDRRAFLAAVIGLPAVVPEGEVFDAEVFGDVLYRRLTAEYAATPEMGAFTRAYLMKSEVAYGTDVFAGTFKGDEGEA